MLTDGLVGCFPSSLMIWVQVVPIILVGIYDKKICSIYNVKSSRLRDYLITLDISSNIFYFIKKKKFFISAAFRVSLRLMDKMKSIFNLRKVYLLTEKKNS